MVDVAEGEHDGAGDVDDGHRAPVSALDLVAPGDLHEDRRRCRASASGGIGTARTVVPRPCAGVLGPVRRAPVLSIGTGAGVLWR